MGSALVTAYLASGRKTHRLTASGRVQAALLAALFVTGVFRVLKNMPDITFSPGFTFFIDASHISFAVIFLVAAVSLAVARRPWLTEKKRA